MADPKEDKKTSSSETDQNGQSGQTEKTQPSALDITSQRVKTAQDEYGSAKTKRESAVTSYTEGQQAYIDNIKDDDKGMYAARRKQITDALTEYEGELKAAQEADKKAQRRANSFRTIAGISDGLSALANLWGTAKGASPQKQYYALPDVNKRNEQMRLERKKDLQAIQDKLRTLREQNAQFTDERAKALADAQLGQAKSGYDIANAEYTAAGTRLQAAEGQQVAAMNAQEGREFQAQQAQEGREFQKEQTEKQMEFQASESNKKIAAERSMQTERLAAAKAEGEETRKSNENVARIRNGQETPEENRRMTTRAYAARDAIARKMGFEDYNDYVNSGESDSRRKNNQGLVKDMQALEIMLVSGKLNKEMVDGMAQHYGVEDTQPELP